MESALEASPPQSIEHGELVLLAIRRNELDEGVEERLFVL
jgi:hypothetical protein